MRPTISQTRHDVVFYAPFIGDIISRAASPPGGAETQILALAKALARRGLRVAIIAYGHRQELPERVDGVWIIPRAAYRLGKKRLVGKLLETFRIWQALWRARPQTVVYRCAGLELGLVALYTRLTRCRLVFSTANMVDFDFYKLARNRRDLFLYHLGVRLTDEIVVQTEEQVARCEAAFGRRPTLIKSIAPLAESQQAEPEAFLWVGRLVSYKQPLAYLALARAVPEARFWMVGVPANDEGEAPLAEQVAAEARGLPNLELLPPRPHAELGKLMGRAVASVNTALFEGMPNVLLEAWCRGVPALVLNHDAGGVVTEHGLGGFATGSPERLAELARAQWRSRQDRAVLAERCRSYVAIHHAPEAVAGEWLEVLAPGRLAARAGPSGRTEARCAA